MTSPGKRTAPVDGAGMRPVLPRALVILLGAASAVIVIAGMEAIAWLLGPAFLALIIVIALAPVRGWLRRKGWPGWLRTLVLIVLVYGVLLFLALGIVVSVARLATVLPQYAAKADDVVGSITDALAGFGVGQAQLDAAASILMTPTPTPTATAPVPVVPAVSHFGG